MSDREDGLKDQEVLLSTFVARIKDSAARSRGDRLQVENYARTVYELTSGEHGHLVAAATGESLALKVITQVVDYSTREFVGDVQVNNRLFPGYAEKRLLTHVGEVLDRELLPTLRDVPDATKKMIVDEILVIATDACRGKNSNAAKLWESAAREQATSNIQRTLDSHAPWFGKLVVEIVKSVSR